MEAKTVDTLSFAERRELCSLAAGLKNVLESRLDETERDRLSSTLRGLVRRPVAAHDYKSLPIAVMTLRTACTFAEMVDPDHNILIAILLHQPVRLELAT